MKLLLSIALLAGLAAAQETAVVSGNVLDATGATVPDANVTALNTKTGVAVIQKSNTSGVYTFLTLQPGEYRFSAEKAGFRKVVVDAVALRVADHLDLNLKLEVGSASETVTVSADAEGVSYLNPTQGNLVNQTRIMDLPTFGRNVMDFVSTTPGLVTTGNGVNVNGSRTDALNATLDGINILDNYINESIQNVQISLSTDRIDELRIVTSPVDAEFGRGSAQVMATSRAGTNSFHGAVYDYLRNDALNANSWANNRSGAIKPILRENTAGARADGPIRHNKTFFFGLFEADVTRSQKTTTATVLTDTARKGIFRFYPGATNSNSLSGNPVVDGSGNPITPRNATGTLQSVSLFGLDPNRLVADTTGNVAKNLALLPSPNTFSAGDGLNTAGYRFVQPFPSQTYSLDARLDHNINQNERLFISYARDANNQPNGVNSAPLPTSVGGLYDQYGMVASAGLISTLRPNLINEFHAGVTRTTIDFLPGWVVQSTDLLPSINKQPYLLSMGVVTSPYSTSTSADPQARLAPLYQASDKVSWLRGIHNVKAGYDVRFSSVHEYLAFDVVPRVTLGLGNVGTQNVRTIDSIGTNATSAENLLATLSGSVSSIVQLFYAPPGKNPQFTPGAYNSHNYRQREMDWFVQDDIRLHRNLTLNLGVRWEYYGVPYEANGRLIGLTGGPGTAFGISGNDSSALFHPGVTPGLLTQLELIGRNSPNSNVQPWKGDYRNLAPVAGLAWNVPWEKFGMNKTVVRLGYSIGYERMPLVVLDNINGSSQPGLSQTVSVAPSVFTNLNGVSLPLTPTQQPLQTTPINDNNASPLSFYAAGNLRTPYVQNWNVSVGREIARGVVLDVRYVGSKGSKLYRGTNIDEINIFENGILNAMQITDAGGNAPLFDQIFKGLNVPSVGVVDGANISGSDAVRKNTTLNAFLLANNAGGLAQFIGYNTFITGTRGGLLLNGKLPANFVDANPQFGVARLVGNTGNSTFNSLQVEVNKRFSRGFTFQASYVRSKTLGDYDGNGQDLTSNFQTIRNLRLDKHPLGFDIPNVWRTNGVWEMPFGPGRALLGHSHGVVARLVEKWQTSVIFNKLSGAPTTFTDSAGGTFNNQVTATPMILGALPKGGVSFSGNNVNYFQGYSLVQDPAVQNLPASLRSTASLFALADPSGKIVMQNPALGTLGGGFVMFRGPGSFTLNMQVSKFVTVNKEHNITMQLRADAANLLNRPIWTAPSLNIDSTTGFGLITGANGTRTVQLGARIQF